MRDLFDDLRQANVERCGAAFHPIAHWSVLEWAGAMCGEAGEAANLAKKIKRGDFKPFDQLTIKGITQTAAEHLADEVADVIIYADLMLARVELEARGNLLPFAGPDYRTDLRQAVIRKFNRVSAERGSKIRLE